MMSDPRRGRRRTLGLVVALALGAVCTGLVPATAQTVAPAPSQVSGAALLSALRGGGYVLYFRHAATDFSQNDDQMTGYEDCAKQRNLTDRGRADARAMGVAIAALGIPVGDVIASPFCRTQETARLIFELGRNAEGADKVDTGSARNERRDRKPRESVPRVGRRQLSCRRRSGGDRAARQGRLRRHRARSAGRMDSARGGGEIGFSRSLGLRASAKNSCPFAVASRKNRNWSQ